MDIKAIMQMVSSLGAFSRGPNAKLDRYGFRPTGAALRDPKDPVQAERIEAARFKRAERAVKAQRNYDRCVSGRA